MMVAWSEDGREPGIPASSEWSNVEEQGNCA